MMKIKILFFSFLLSSIAINCLGQENSVGFVVPIPQDWTTENMNLPPKFAPTLPLKGTEEVLYAPEWDTENALDYRSSCIVWALQGNIHLMPNNLEKYLQEYYKGLIKSKQTTKKTTTEIPVKATLRVLPEGGKYKRDKQTFEGHIEMIDYKTQKRTVLNLRIHVKHTGEGYAYTNVYIETSPADFQFPIWLQLERMGGLDR